MSLLGESNSHRVKIVIVRIKEFNMVRHGVKLIKKYKIFYL